MTGEVAIVGCGPSGMLAAHAAVLAGSQPTLFSKKAEQSPHAAATFLHRGIPDLTGRADAKIRFDRIGSSRGYAEKVYHDPDRATSWSRFPSGEVAAWALAPVYDELWARYRGLVSEVEIDPEGIRNLLESFPLVVNTAPAWCVCEGDHAFHKRDIWILDEAPDFVHPNTMVYNGLRGDDWYRASDIFGTRSTEYTANNPSVIGYARLPTEKGKDISIALGPNGVKVIGTDCDCHPDLLRAGRWGTWRPGELMHQAFEAVVNAL